MGKDNEIEQIIVEIRKVIDEKIKILDESELSEKINIFINEILAKIDPPTMSLNIYKDGKDARIKRNNLKYYLMNLNPTLLFVGEAPGRWGCYRTGIPFTDINTLTKNEFFRDCFEDRKDKKEACLYIASFEGKKFRKEPSSTIVWKCLNELFISEKSGLPLLWNIYPFHPSNTCNNCTFAEERPNRAPNANERKLGMEILKGLLACFSSIKKIYAIGRKAEKTLKIQNDISQLANRGNEDIYIRHPANGGKNDFISGFRKICTESEEPKNQNNQKKNKNPL